MLDWSHPEIAETIRHALAEDIGTGDVTTEACVPEDAVASGYFLTREPLVLAGTPLLASIYDREEVAILAEDGAELPGDTVFARVRGSARRLLTLERTALNLIQRTCGIASLARVFARAVEGTGCRVLDTRKTTPGLRRIEKLAVRAGGCQNHRLGLFDAVLIKNNHIAAAGGLRRAVELCRARSSAAIEVEARSFAELDEALDCGAERILLDNFSPAEARVAVERIARRAVVEISGGVTLETVRAYAEAGADFVSVGALTHSARAKDISFRIDPA